MLPAPASVARYEQRVGQLMIALARGSVPILLEHDQGDREWRQLPLGRKRAHPPMQHCQHGNPVCHEGVGAYPCHTRRRLACSGLCPC